MSDLYSEFTEHLNTPPGWWVPGGGLVEFERLTPKGEDNINERRVAKMAYSKKAKTAEANAEEKKDIITIDDIEVVRAAEVKENRVLFDIKVKGISISSMVLQHYTNKEGVEGDMISFPQYKGKNDKYYTYAWFPISKEMKEQIIEKVVALL